MSARLSLLLFVVPLLFLSACSSGGGRYGHIDPTRVDSSQVRDSPQIQRATMRPYKVGGKWYYPSSVDVGHTSTGIASWYGPTFHGKKTSNGETYSMYAHTAAHKTLPMNTIVKVTNRENGRSTVVRINDRGPFVPGRIIDLSNVAAREIDMLKKGTAPVKVEVIGFGGVISRKSSAPIPKEVADSHEFEVGNVESSVKMGRFLVQIGAFRKREGAERFRAQNSSVHGYRAVVRDFWLDGAPIYRVLLSGFQSEEEARDFIANEPIASGAFVITE